MEEAVNFTEWVEPESSIEARRISVEEWSAHWPLITVELDRIPQFWSDYWTKEAINTAVMIGMWQAWGFGRKGLINVVVLSQVLDFPAGRYLQMILAFGNSLDACLPLMDATLERFAMEMECDVCEINNGRAGWERKLPRFTKTGVVLKARVPRKGIH